MIRVILAEDSFIVREGLREILAAQPGVDVVAACGDLDGLLEAVREHDPDVVITDIRMPPSNTDEGIRAAARLRESHPRVGVVVLSQYSDPGYVLALLESGSDGRAYLLKERVHDLGQLTSAHRGGGRRRIGDRPEDRRGARGGEGARATAHRWRSSPSASAACWPRSLRGRATRRSPSPLELSKRAVEKHTHAIFTKLGLANSAEVSKRVKAALLFLAEAGSEPSVSRENASLLGRELRVGQHSLLLQRGQILELLDAVRGRRRRRSRRGRRRLSVSLLRGRLLRRPA